MLTKNYFTTSPYQFAVTALLIGLSVSSSYANSSKKKTIDNNYKIKAAETIDKYVEEMITKNKLEIPKQISDEKYVRRIYLTVTGRIPTLEELNRYLNNKSPYKRDMLAQQLINSSGYVSNMTNYYYDLLRMTETFHRGASAISYLNYVRNAVETNKPWNDFAYELTSAEGSVWNNGAVGYYVKDRGMRLDNLGMTVSLFNGTNMECAQCHDHPHNEIERLDFYKLAAFSEGMVSSNASEKLIGAIYSTENEKYYKAKDAGKPYDRGYGSFLRSMNFAFGQTNNIGTAQGQIALPVDYQYNDADPGEIVTAETPFEHRVKMRGAKKGHNGNQKFAEWLTQDNKRFTSVIANRMWKRIMGTGIYEPVDKYVADEKTLSPKLSNLLSTIMLDTNYSLKDFQHILLLTKTFGYETSEKSIRTNLYPQNGRQLSRLSAEQIWDSFLVLKEGNPDSLKKRGNSNSLKIGKVAFGPNQLDVVEVYNKVASFKDRENLEKYLYDVYSGEISTSSKPVASNTDSDGEEMMSMDMMSDAPRGGGALKGYYRASELSAPAAPNHLLRQFGQSDRQLIENSDLEANVPQVLAMLNGHVEGVIVSDKNAYVYKSVNDKSTVEENITNLFLSTLTRKPNEVELSIFKQEIETEGKSGYSNILSALLISREFLFIQ
ncbi:DUF1549 domain-containing protein [Akkermansiaceae bacterium]|nr:DUF1549 domain-containing protein [Akkermansiaceae bacterium]